MMRLTKWSADTFAVAPLSKLLVPLLYARIQLEYQVLPAEGQKVESSTDCPPGIFDAEPSLLAALHCTAHPP